MVYPLSTDVSSGQPTAVDHYNNLRADALRFGNLAADAVNLGTLMDRYESNLNLVYLSANRVRIEASPTSPVSLVIDGIPLRTVANVDLPTASAPSGAAGDYYVFAIRSAGSTSFTLSVNTSPTEWTGARRIGQFYWDGSALVRNSIRTEYRSFLTDLLKYAPPQSCQGRLTLTPAVSVTTTDVTAGTLLFTPCLGNSVDLYAPGFGWVPYTFEELSLSFAGVAADLNHDVFVHYDGTDLALEKVAWSNNTTRAVAVILQNGRYVKSGEIHKLYLGSVRTASTGNLADTLLKRFVWNYYNRFPRPMRLKDTTASWTKVNDAAYTQMRATAANMLEFLVGISEQPVSVKQSVHTLVPPTYPGYISIGLDAVNAVAADAVIAVIGSDGNYRSTLISSYLGYPGIGYHYLAPIEAGNAAATITFFGNGQQLMEGTIWA